MKHNDDLSYFESEEFRDILQRYEAMRHSGKMGYMDADELTDIADYYVSVCHDEASADEAIDLALSLHPDAVGPQVVQARRAIRQGHYDSAQSIIDNLMHLDLREATLLQEEMLCSRACYDEALECILSYEGNDGDDDLDYFYYDAAYVFVEADQPEMALRIAAVLSEMAPKWYMTWELMADILLAMKRFEEALTYLNDMLDVEAFDVETWNWCVEAYCGIGDYESAMDSVENALAIEPDDPRAIQLKAWLLLTTGHSDEAHRLYVHAQEQQPQVASNWVFDGDALLEMEHPDEALDKLEHGFGLADIQTDMDTVLSAYELRCQALTALGRHDEAFALLENADAALLEDPDVRTSFEIVKARIYVDLGDIDNALMRMDEACRIDNANADMLRFRMAEILYDYGYDDDALQLFCNIQDSLPVDSDKAACQTYIAACLMQKGQKIQALDALSKAQQMNADNITDLFASFFPEGVKPEEYTDYLFRDIHGHWPWEQR